MSVGVCSWYATSLAPSSEPAKSTTSRVRVHDSGSLAEAIGSGRGQLFPSIDMSKARIFD